MEIRARLSSDGTIELSPHAKATLRENAGARIIITLDNRESAELRRFFEGAVVKYWFYQHPHSRWKDYREARENLKLLFNPFFTKSISGETKMFPGTTAMSKKKWERFMERIEHHFIDNGMEFPDSAAYKAWEDSAPEPGTVYPPLLALKQAYELAKMNG